MLFAKILKLDRRVILKYILIPRELIVMAMLA